MEWKINLVKELTNVKMNQLSMVFANESLLTMDEIDDILNLVTYE